MARRRRSPGAHGIPIGDDVRARPQPGRGRAAVPPAAPGAPAPPPEPPQILPGFGGMPPDVQARVDAILRDGAPNPEQRALAYIRTTPWYAVEYRGIAQGVARGMFGAEAPEAEYRAWKTGANQAYRQYYGREASGDELEAFLAAGYSPTIISQIGAGKAYIDANRGELQYLAGAFGEGRLDEAQLQSYGEQVVGRGSTLGTTIQSKVETAMRKVQRVFEGSLATSPLALDSLSQAQQRQRKPNISA